MRRPARWAAAALLGLCLGAVVPRARALAASDPAEPKEQAGLIEAGRYLAAAGDCVACHTRPGGAAYAGGREFTTAFGVLYSANISSDPATGIGRWSEAQFTRALREGLGADGRRLYPAFPYTAYTKLSDADVRALYVFLRSVPAVRESPPPNRLRFPYNQRALLRVWNLLYLKGGRYVPDRSRSAEWNRGAYLTQGLGHCGSCHSPRNALGAERSNLALTGGVYWDSIDDAVSEEHIVPMDEPTVRRWSAANLTPARTGLGAWTVDDVATYLKSGHNARAGAFGPMSEVIANSTRHLDDADLHAIGVYLKGIPATEQPVAARAAAGAEDSRHSAGEIAYTARCGDCHQPTGLGMPRVAGADPSKTAPPLAGNAALQAPDPATLINVVLYGAHEGAIADGAWPRMSGFELSVGLDDGAIAALCTYVRTSWGNHAGAVDIAAVARQH